MDGADGDAPDGTVTTVWRRGNKFFTDRPSESEVELGDGVQPWIASGKGGDFALWEREGSIVGTSGGPAKAFRGGIRPVVGMVGGSGMAVWSDAQGALWTQRF